MSTEIVRAEPVAPSLPDMVRYADHLANANLLPAQYRQKPANVLYAMEYGRTLGITPIAAITGIHVIEGKPSASAALISGLVRQAGHKLRVRMQDGTAIATIVRSDDPDFEFRSEWTIERARQAGLVGKDVWKKYPDAMLKARAITEVARDACEEVLFGLHYTPEELGARVGEDGLPMDAEVQQLRRVQPDEADPWATPAKKPQGARGDFVAEAAAASNADDVRRIWQMARGAGEAAERLAQIAEFGRRLTVAESASSEAAGETVDGEIVQDAPDDEHSAMVAELRAFAAQVGIDDIDRDAHGALGVPLADAAPSAIRGLLAQLRGIAA